VTSEFQKAKTWRETRGWSVRDLAVRTGFSENAIYKFEQGFVVYDGRRKKVDKSAWQRFKTACAGADAIARGKRFDW
jgi:hypothetical protein